MAKDKVPRPTVSPHETMAKDRTAQAEIPSQFTWNGSEIPEDT